MPAIGQQAPDFELLNQEGQLLRLSDLRGQRVILFAFPKAATTGCTTQACGFRDNFPQIEAGDAVVLGISPDEPAALLKWKQEENLPYDLLSDPQQRVIRQWQAGASLFGLINLPVARRSFWVIDEEGVLVDMQIGISPDESVARALRALDGAGAD
jgi:peroxiredoxin Q/BCP